MSSNQRKWGMLVVLSLALAVIILDTTILNVALSSIIKDLGTDIQSIQWVITAYSLTLAALTITGGRMGDIFGKKRMFIFGALLFAAGSFLASVSTNVGMLIAGESIIEGIGAALMMPATASLLVENFFGHERAIAFGVWGGIAGASAALGPIVGGFLATNYSWRWGFRVNLIVVLLLVIGSVLIPKSEAKKKRIELDLLGVLLSAVGMLSLVFGIIESSTYGWWKAKAVFVVADRAFVMPWDLSVVPFFIAIGAIVLGAFLFWEKKHEAAGHTALVSPAIFKNRVFTSGILTTAVMSLGQTGLIFSLPVFLQAVRGLDAFHTGLALLPMSLSLLVIAPLSAVLSKKVSPKALISFGLFINFIAYIVLHETLTIDSVANDLIPGLALFGMGMGFVMSQINNITLSSVPHEQAGEASGINNTLRQVGATLGSAIMGAILIGSLGSNMSNGVTSSPVIPEIMKPQIAQAISSQASNVEFGGGAHLGANLPAGVSDEIIRISHQSTTDASKETLVFGAAFAFFGFLVALALLPGKKTIAATMKREDQLTESEASVSLPVVPQSLDRVMSSDIVLDTSMIGELIAQDLALQARGASGLGTAVRALIDASRIHSDVMVTIDPTMIHARRLWDAGFGTALNFDSFEAYAKSLPAVPHALQTETAGFEQLLLIDARVSPGATAKLLGVTIEGSATTAAQESLQAVGEPYWTRISLAPEHVGVSVADASGNLLATERGATIIEALMMTLYSPMVLQDRYLDCPGNFHEGFENSVACIGKWNGAVQIRYRWRDHADARCGMVLALK